MVWPMPITLDLTQEQAGNLEIGQRIALIEPAESITLAIMTVESIYKPDKSNEAKKVFGADDRAHPAVRYLWETAGDVYVGGKLQGLNLPPHYDFVDLRRTPGELRAEMAKHSWNKVVAFQTRNPMHRSHRELTVRASREQHANLLIHPVVGMTKPGDVDHYTRVRCYLEMISHYPPDMVILSLLPLAMRMGGPREALWHALIRKNYGATHFIVGRDHAGPGNNSAGEPFYGNYDAQNLVTSFQEEIGIEMVPFKMVVYVEDTGEYMPVDEVPEGYRQLNISGTELRRRLYKGIPIPEWFSFPKVVKILQQSYPPRSKQGFTLFFTGYSSSGKSTIAQAVGSALLEEGSRVVTVLSGSTIRGLLSTNLGYTKKDRNKNIQRVSYVASQITRAGGVAITTAIAPYKDGRDFCRKLVGNNNFIMVYLNTPLEVCEKRDRKGNYKKARAGLIPNFTGVNDPYEEPENPDITINTEKLTVKQAVHEIMLFLDNEGFFNGGSAM